MIRNSIRQRLKVLLPIAVVGLVGGYGLLRGGNGTFLAAAKTEAETLPAPVSTSVITPAGAPQTPAQGKLTSELPAAKPRARKTVATPQRSAAKLVPTGVSISIGNSNSENANPKPSQPAPQRISFKPKEMDPTLMMSPIPGTPPVPQGGSGTPPNAPTVSSPANGSSSVSTSPTLKVNVSDPNSNNVTVNFYGKVVPSSAPGPNFSIIELPDTQYYSASLENGTPAIFSAQTQWIVNNRVANNIVFVTGLGDVVQDGNNNGDYSEWDNANAAISLLDDPVATGLPQGIPYSFGVGNHDQGPTGDGSPDDTAAFNQYLGAARYANKPDYGGHYGTDNDNHYELFSASGMDFILINIAYMDPQYNATELNSVLAWASNLLQTYPTRRGIIVSHYLLNSGFNASWSGQGQSTYTALQGNPNLFLMLAGHLTPPEGQRTDVSNGNRVFTFLSDYQESGFGGDGWLRILNFLPATNQIQVQTYSPYLNQYENTAAGNFTVSYDMTGSGNGFTLLASNSGVLSGTSTSYTWPNLAPGSSYEWYVTVTNSTGTAVGPLWNFATAGNPPVTISPTSLSFGNQPDNTTSASQPVTFTNSGSSAVTITSIAASAQFGQTNNCPISPSTLAAGNSCTINVTFTPSATGTQTGTLSINDTAVGSPQQVPLSGSGTTVVAPAVSLSPSSLTFATPSVTVVQDTGTTGSGSGTLAAKFASNVTKNNLMVVGVSSFAGNAFATPAITDTLGSTWTLAIAENPGTTGTPALASLYYAIVPSTGADTITVHMTGTNNLHLHIYEVSGIVTSAMLDKTGFNFQTSGTAATVSTSAATTSMNEFVFAYFGRDNGSGTWTGGSGYSNTLATPNSGAGTDAFSEDKIITAAGVQTATATSSASDALTSLIATFVAAGGGTPVGTTSAAQSVTLTNTGTASLNLTSIAASGDFGQTNTCGSFVAAAGSCTISVTFTPTATATRTGAITITDNSSDSPETINLTGTGTPASGPAANVSPTNLTFSSQTVNTTSAAQTVTLTNAGTTTMSITSIVASAQYSQTNTCGSSLTAGNPCTISVTFTPTGTGTQTGTITITDNAPGSPHIVNLTGTGSAATAPAAGFSPTSLTFGSQTLNTTSGSQPITLTNSGTATLNITSIAASTQYAQTNTCGTSVIAGGNCTINVTFTPTATGTQTGTIKVTDNATGSPQSVTLTGTGTNATAPAVGLSPTSLTFSSQTLNTTSPAQSITLTNSGTATLNLTSIVASAKYAQTNTCGSSVAAGGNCSISVTFTPTATGTQTGTITITDNASGSPQTVNLTGTGANATAPAVSLSPTSLTFTSQTLNTTSAAQTITLTNSGTASLGITNITASAQYAQTNTCGSSVAAGSKCTVSVTFTPTATGTQTGSITIADNATGSPQTVGLTGTGASSGGATTVSLSASSLTFAIQEVGTSSTTKNVNVTNTGSSALTVTSVVPTGDFSQTNTCATSVNSGSRCTITVTFTPTAAGTRTGSLTIADNATNSPQTVNLTGTAANITLSPTSLSFGTVTLNTTSPSQPITLTNAGTIALSVTRIKASSQFAETNTCGTSIAGGASCTITVTFKPTTAGSHPGTLTLTDNATGSLKTVSLTGTGQ